MYLSWVSSRFPAPAALAAAPSNRRRSGVGARIVLTVFTVLGVVLLVVVLGAFFPGLPLYVGVVASVLSGFAAWLGVLALVLLVAAALLLRRRRTPWRVVVAAVTVLALIGCVVITARLVAVGAANGVTINPFAPATKTRAPDATVQYASDAGTALHVAVWKPTAPRAGGAPVAFFIHGGGWVEGDALQDNNGLRGELADAGWLVVSVDYTLATSDRHTWDLVEGQVGCALAWTQQNAAAYGGNPGTFVTFGDSAGGELALNTTYRATAGTLTCPATGPLPNVDAVVTLYPGVNPYALYDDTVWGKAPGQTFMDRYIGGSPQDFPDAYRSVDSSTHIVSNAPPTLILQGQNDHLVRAHAVVDFAAQARQAGIDTTLITVPYGEHVFDVSPMGSQLYKRIAVDWLRQHGITGR